MPTRSRFPRARTALLLVDVINPFDFTGGRAFAARATRIASRLRRFKARCKRAGIPVIYVNDNLGKWRSSIETIVDICTRVDMPGRTIARLLEPDEDDHVVLKSALSGFYQTPLETMLRSGGVRQVIVTGFAADNCVFFTAADAYMRDYRVVVPRDCVGAQNAREHREAIRKMVRLLGARVTSAVRLSLSR